MSSIKKTHVIHLLLVIQGIKIDRLKFKKFSSPPPPFHSFLISLDKANLRHIDKITLICMNFQKNKIQMTKNIYYFTIKCYVSVLSTFSCLSYLENQLKFIISRKSVENTNNDYILLNPVFTFT